MKYILFIFLLISALLPATSADAKIKLYGTFLNLGHNSGTNDLYLRSSNTLKLPFPAKDSVSYETHDVYTNLSHRLINKGLAGWKQRYYLTVTKSANLLITDKNKLPFIEVHKDGILVQKIGLKKIMRMESSSIELALKEKDVEQMQTASAAYIVFFLEGGDMQRVKLPDDVFVEWQQITNKEFAFKVLKNTNAERKRLGWINRDLDPYDVDPQ